MNYPENRDIVERLRLSPLLFKRDLLEQWIPDYDLTASRMNTRTVDLMKEAADEIERLRKERDEARRLWCVDIGELYSSSSLSLAKERGWDCFKEASDER